jgi:hypothetical protein
MVPEPSNVEPPSPMMETPSPKPTNSSHSSTAAPAVPHSQSEASPSSASTSSALRLALPQSQPLSEKSPGPVFEPPPLADVVNRTDRRHSSTMEKPDSEKTPASAERPTAVSRELPKLLNKHELLIAPNEHSIVEDALLRCTPYIVNTKYKVLICTCCRYSFNPDRALDHLRKYHPQCKVQAEFAILVRTKFPGLVCESIQPLEVPEPVFGLAIPIEPYTICARCRRGYANIASWRCHACGNAGANLAGQPDHFSSLVQTFFRGPQVCYFPVQNPASNLNKQDNDFDLFKSCFQDLPVSEEIDEPDDYRELNQFLLKEGWISHIKGHSPSELSILTAPPKDGEIFKPIASDVVALMRNIQIAIGRAGYHVRRLLGKRPT